MATDDDRVLHFQQWWVGERAKPDVDRVGLPAVGAAANIALACDIVVAALEGAALDAGFNHHVA